jgi:hypothetical protein
VKSVLVSGREESAICSQRTSGKSIFSTVQPSCLTMFTGRIEWRDEVLRVTNSMVRKIALNERGGKRKLVDDLDCLSERVSARSMVLSIVINKGSTEYNL